MNNNYYPDFIRFKDVVGVRSKKCRINNIHDGLIYATIDDKEYIVPRSSVLVIIRNARRGK